MINRIQLVNNKKNDVQNFGSFRSESRDGRKLLNDAFVLLSRPTRVKSPSTFWRGYNYFSNLLNPEYIKAAKAAFKRARKMETDFVLMEKNKGGKIRFNIKVTLDGSIKIVHLATMSQFDSPIQKALATRKFLDNFANIVNAADEVEDFNRRGGIF